MKVILDTNVFISGAFFSGPPYEILKAWNQGKFHLVISPEILEEYQRVGKSLARQFHGVDLEPILELIAIEAQLTMAPALPHTVCDDPDDDKFLACAIASKTKVIVTGDKQLLKVSGYHGVRILRPRKFVERYLRS